MVNFNFSEKGLGLVSPPHFVYHFVYQRKCFSCYNLLTDQIALSDAFPSQDIGQYVYYNCFVNQAVRS